MRKLIFFITLVVGMGFFIAFRTSVPSSSPEGIASMEFAKAVIPNLLNGNKRDTENALPTESMDQEILAFRNYLQESAKGLPTIKSVRSNPKNNFHHAPIGLIETSETFGNIAEKLKEHKKFTSDALRFYSSCAKSESLLSSVRAVCLRNLIDWSERKGRAINPNVYAPHILNIANNLPRSQ